MVAVAVAAGVYHMPGRTMASAIGYGAAFGLFPIGWVGVFLTGSDTSANALFGNLQVVTANRLGLNPILMASSNSSGGVMGKMISLQNIAVGAAATGMKPAEEARLFRFVLRHSITLALFIATLVVFYAYVAPYWVP